MDITIQRQNALKEIERLKELCTAQGKMKPLPDVVMIERFLQGKSYATGDQILLALKEVLNIENQTHPMNLNHQERLILEVTQHCHELDHTGQLEACS